MRITHLFKEKIVPSVSSKNSHRAKPSAVSDFFNSQSSIRKIELSKEALTAPPHSATNAPKIQRESAQVWYRVSQLAAKHQQFTENAIRALLFAAKPRLSAKTKNGNSWIKGNGLAPAIRKCGRSVLINEPMFAKWIETGSCGQGSQA